MQPKIIYVFFILTFWLIFPVKAQFAPPNSEEVIIDPNTIELEQDPFNPFRFTPTINDPQPTTTNAAEQAFTQQPEIYVDPMIKYPIHTYKLVGVMISSQKAIAMIKTQDNQEFIVRIGDEVGMEGGIIENISQNAIDVIDDSDNQTTIIVRNKIEVSKNAIR